MITQASGPLISPTQLYQLSSHFRDESTESRPAASNTSGQKTTARVGSSAHRPDVKW